MKHSLSIHYLTRNSIKNNIYYSIIWDNDAIFYIAIFINQLQWATY